jgi:PIN domain nuclease of toxin-antitoxin system
MTLLLDSHVLLWTTSDRSRLSTSALNAVSSGEELAVAPVTWYELAWLATHQRIDVPSPVGVWIEDLASQVRTASITPAIATTAAFLPATFPGDPVDRIIYATALENGWRLVTRDERMHDHPHPRQFLIW